MNQIRAMIATFRKEMRVVIFDLGIFVEIFGESTRTAAIAWIAVQKHDPVFITYVFVAAPVMSIWFGGVFRVGWSLVNEISGKTFDFAILSRTLLIVVLFGKTIAHIISRIPFALVSALVVFGVARQLPVVASPWLFPIAIVFLMVSMAITSLLFSPLMVLSGGRAGFFNFIIPFGAVLSGFIVPVGMLPRGLEIFSRVLPTSWSMDLVWLSINGAESVSDILSIVLGCLISAILIFSFTYYLSKVVEKRILVTGTLVTA